MFGKQHGVFILILLMMTLSASFIASSGRAQQLAAGGRTAGLVADDKRLREDSLRQILLDFRNSSDALKSSLTIAIEKSSDDHRYLSPVHCAIMAVGECRAYEAEALVISQLTYQIDPASIPVGTGISGDAFYPAARALVQLRIDMRKLIDAMLASNDSKQLRLLSWVLNERTGSMETTKAMLTAAIQTASGEKQRKNLDIALKLWDNPAEVLPQPDKVGAP